MENLLTNGLAPLEIQSKVGNHKISVSDALVRCLIEAGVDYVFGMPGGATIPFHKSIDDVDEIDFVLTSHEGGAAYMADCYARVSGKISVCCATTGPGATNLLTGVASALQDSVPMLVITGMNPMDTWGRGDFQESSPYWLLDTVKIFSTVCKLSEVVVSEKTLLHRVQNAIATALRGRPGPVHLAIPRDIWSKKIHYKPLDPVILLPCVPAPSSDAINQVISALESADHPLIIFGSGASSEAVACLFELSKKHCIPIISTPRAKGKLFTSASPYYLGSMGISATPMVDELFEATEFDTVLTVGVGFNSYATNAWDKIVESTATMIQVNIAPEEIGRNYRANIGIVADGAVFAENLLARDNVFSAPHFLSQRRKWADGWAARPKWPLSTTPHSQDGKGIHPLDIIRAVDKVVQDNGIVLADSSSILLWATHYFPDRPNRRLLTVWGWASMGHVTAGAIGAKLAEPTADVVVLTGDGCFLMNGNEIATAVGLNLPIVWVVNVNAQLGMIHYELRESKKTASATMLHHDFAGFAKALGAHGVTCSNATELPDLIAEGLKKSAPTVIHVEADVMPTPPVGNKRAGGARWKEYVAGI